MEDKLVTAQSGLRQLREEYDDLCTRHDMLTEDYLATQSTALEQKQVNQLLHQANKEDLLDLRRELCDCVAKYSTAKDTALEQVNQLRKEHACVTEFLQAQVEILEILTKERNLEQCVQVIINAGHVLFL